MPAFTRDPISRRVMLSLVGASAMLPATRIAAWAEDNWVVFRREDLGFQLEMPGTPEVEEDEVRPEDYLYQSGLRRDGLAKVSTPTIDYSCGWSQWRYHHTLETALNMEMEVFKTISVPPIRQTALDVDGHRGVELASLQSFVALMRVFVINGNILTVSLAGGEDPAILETATSRRFLDSLKILMKAP
jgi:hypothetical protein